MKTSIDIFDISNLAAHQRCSSIFSLFDGLKQGESFIFETTEDPLPLYHHLLEMRAEPFGWQRLEDGPLRWQVKITKPEREEEDKTIGEIAASDYLKA